MLRPRVPVPRGGWPAVIVPTALAAALWAVAAFAATALLLPTLDLECSTTATGATLCPRPQDRDPVLTHLFDVTWPEVNSLWAICLMFLPALLGAMIGAVVDQVQPWKNTGDGPAVLTMLAAVTGIGTGLVVAGPGFVTLLPALCVTAAGLLTYLAAGFAVRAFRQALRDNEAAHLRVIELREHGLRTRAPVVEFFRGDGEFTVTARLEDGTTVTGDLRVPEADAPVAGGTVLVYTDGKRDHPTGIDTLMEPDPDSVRGSALNRSDDSP